MKRCVIISAYFPPVGGIGVQRVSKLVKYLPAGGWHPVVITTPRHALRMPQDPSMLRDLPDSLEIHRPFYYDSRKIIPGDIAKLYAPVEKRILFPDRLKSWNRGVIRCLDRLVRSEPIGAVLINVAPFSGLLLSRAIKKRFSIPVVLNFRDAFSFNNYYQLHRRSRDMHRAMDVEREAFDSADRAVFVTPFMMSGYSRIFPEYAHKMCVIPNGYDEDDFLEFDPDSGPEPGTGPGENCFTIGYNGSFSKLVPMRPLAHALCTIYETHGIRIRLSIATKNTESEFRKLFPDLFRLGLVDYRGFLPHRESLANLGRAHLLTFMFADNPATEGAFSGKVFEYLRTYKPILLLHKKDSDIARLIADTTAGITVHIDSQDEIIRAILHFHELWQNGRLRHVPDKARIRQYDYRTLAKQMASVFDALQADEKGE